MQPGMFLSKKVWAIVTWQMERSSTIDVPGAYTLLGKPKVTASNAPGVKRPQSVASAFLEKCASITAVN